MRKLIIIKSIIIAMIISFSNYYAQNNELQRQTSLLYDIVNIIPAPTSDTRDLAFDGEYLWTGVRSSNLIFKLSPVDGTIIKTIPTTIEKPYGLTFDGNYLWIAGNQNQIIQQIDTSDGSVIKTISTPGYSLESYPYGLAWDGNNLWHNDTKDPSINVPGDSTFYIDTDGNILAAYDAHGGYPTGLAFDGQFLWSSDNEFAEIHKIRISDFTIVETISAPGGDYPNGLTWDGQYLWVANNDTDSLYQLDVSGGTAIENEDQLPLKFSLSQNYPNPFNPTTKIKFTIPQTGFTSLKVYDVLGNEVTTLVNEEKPAGEYEVEFDANTLTSSVYFYRLRAGEFIQTKKMILIK